MFSHSIHSTSLTNGSGTPLVAETLNIECLEHDHRGLIQYNPVWASQHTGSTVCGMRNVLIFDLPSRMA